MGWSGATTTHRRPRAMVVVGGVDTNMAEERGIKEE
jgi:hypothetical protein